MKTKLFKNSMFLLLGCLLQINTSIAQSPVDVLKSPVEVTIVPVNPLCSNSSNGLIKIFFSGGTQPYSVNGQTLPGSDFILSGLTGGQYNFVLSDFNNYNSTVSVNLVTPNPIQVSAIITNVSTFMGSDGSIDISTNASSPTYQWTTTSGSNLSANSQDQTNLTSGVYFLELTDINGCSLTKKYTVFQPVAPIVPSIGNSNDFNISSEQPMIYPNPSTGKISLTDPTKEGFMHISNENGLLMKEIQLSDLDSINLEKGIYHIRIEYTDGNTSSTQLIVQ